MNQATLDFSANLGMRPGFANGDDHNRQESHHAENQHTCIECSGNVCVLTAVETRFSDSYNKIEFLVEVAGQKHELLHSAGQDILLQSHVITDCLLRFCTIALANVNIEAKSCQKRPNCGLQGSILEEV